MIALAVFLAQLGAPKVAENLPEVIAAALQPEGSCRACEDTVRAFISSICRIPDIRSPDGNDPDLHSPFGRCRRLQGMRARIEMQHVMNLKPRRFKCGLPGFVAVGSRAFCS